jgi:hypothetical protein
MVGDAGDKIVSGAGYGDHLFAMGQNHESQGVIVWGRPAGAVSSRLGRHRNHPPWTLSRAWNSYPALV